MSKGKISPAYVVALADILLVRFEAERRKKINDIYRAHYAAYVNSAPTFLGILTSIRWAHWFNCYFRKQPVLTFEEFKVNPQWTGPYEKPYHLHWLENNDKECGHRVKDVITLRALKSLYAVSNRTEEIWLDSNDAQLLEEAVQEYNASREAAPVVKPGFVKEAFAKLDEKHPS